MFTQRVMSVAVSSGCLVGPCIVVRLSACVGCDGIGFESSTLLCLSTCVAAKYLLDADECVWLCVSLCVRAKDLLSTDVCIRTCVYVSVCMLCVDAPLLVVSLRPHPVQPVGDA